jgi:hypothetical protein
MTRYSSKEDIRNLAEARENGATTCATWEEYIQEKADEFGTSLERATMIFDLLGSTEAFDGFITTMEDVSDEEEGF